MRAIVLTSWYYNVTLKYKTKGQTMKRGDQVKNRVKVLIAEKETRENRRITYRTIEAETGLSKNTVGKWARNEVQDYNRGVIRTFCDYFKCDVGSLIFYDRTES